MARPSNTAERRAQIAEAAMRVIARDGYDAATTQAIARESRLAPGLVHYHFDDKRALLLEVLARLEVRVRARVDTRLASVGSARARLYALIDAYLEIGRDADAVAVAAWNALAAAAPRDPDVRRVYRRALTRTVLELRPALRAALRESASPVRDVPRLAAAILAAIEGALHVGMLAPGVIPPGSAGPTVRTLVAGLLDGARP